MSVDYRLIRPDEVEAALDLWGIELPATRAEIARDYQADPDHLAHTHVAVAADGRLLSAVHYILRYLRDVDGRPRLVGGVSHVATQEAAQGQGHAGRLMEQAIVVMQQAGCDWSLLFTEVNRFYERFGWQTMPTRYRQGMLSGRSLAGAADYAVRRYRPGSEPVDWAALAAVYDAYNAHRPLTTVRESAYWQRYLVPRFTAPPVAIWVAGRPATLMSAQGYTLAYFYEQTFVLTEIGVLPGEEAAIPALVTAVLDHANQCRIRMGRVYLPVEPAIDAVVATMFAPVQLDYHHVLMARPLTADCSMSHIEAIFNAPGAIAWPADDF